ncbi:MAG: hypothetical protein AAFO82_16745, partial [Bacteroidota bacterium]
FMMLHGGESLAFRTEKLGASFQLVTGINGGHEWAGKPVAEYVYIEQIAQFLKHTVIEGKLLQSRLEVEQNVECALKK